MTTRHVTRNSRGRLQGTVAERDRELTSRPKHKHIVLPSWVHECIDEETLMNEDGEH